MVTTSWNWRHPFVGQQGAPVHGIMVRPNRRCQDLVPGISQVPHLITAAQATKVKWSGRIRRPRTRGLAAAEPTSAMRKDEMPMHEFTDVTYEVEDGLAWITINRPERYNAFRARTVDELIHGFKRAWVSDEVGVICPDRRRRQGVLHRRRPEAADGDRRLRAVGERPVRGRLAAPRHPRRPQAGHRRGQRVRHRRRPRAARAVRPDDRRRHRVVRPERPAGRLVRRRASAPATWPGSSARSGPARSGSCCRQYSASRPWSGAWSTRWCRPTSCAPRSGRGRTKSCSSPRPRSRCSSSRSTPTPSTSSASARWPTPRLKMFGETAGGQGGHRRVQREAQPRLLRLPRQLTCGPSPAGCSTASAS